AVNDFMDSVHHIWCPLFSQEFQDLPDGAETTLTQKVDDEVVFCMRCCFFVRWQASGVRMPPVRAGLFRRGHFQGEAVASRL
ncbi:hypothetical protein ACRWHJ_22845, partial [Escherichia coli]